MSDDKTAPPSKPDQLIGSRRSDGQDPLALFPTESEVAEAKKAESRAHASRDAKEPRDKNTAAASEDRPRGRRWLRAAGTAVLVLLVLVLASGATVWFVFPDLVTSLKRQAFGTPADPVSTLVIQTTPPGWSVTEGDKVLGRTPLSIVLRPGKHALVLRRGTTASPLTVTLPAGMEIVHHLDLTEPPAAPTVGALQVTTQPPGAAVAIDGTLRGPAPLRLDDLTPGDHTVVVANAARTVSQTVAIKAGETATLVVPLGQVPPAPPAAPSAQTPTVGWVVVNAGIELQVYDGDSLVGSSRNQRIMLMPGAHALKTVNAAVGFESTSTVTIRAGAVSTVNVQVPNGSLSVNAVPWAEVLLDGTMIGETPIANYAVAPGTHELVFRNPRYPEQRRTVVVSLSSPTHVGVDLR